MRAISSVHAVRMFPPWSSLTEEIWCGHKTVEHRMKKIIDKVQTEKKHKNYGA